jgi:hypothetical protein
MRKSILAVALLAVVGTNLYSQDKPSSKCPRPVVSRADETLEAWNEIGN